MNEAVAQILRDVKYPTSILFLDFECHFDKTYNLSKLSTIEYVKSPKFEVLGLAYRIEPAKRSNNTQFIVGKDAVGDFLKAAYSTCSFTTVCHNASFDCLILAERFNIFPKFIIDTIALSRHVNARSKHSLEYLAKFYNLGVKGDTKEFMGLSCKHIVDSDTLTKLASYAINDVELTAKLFDLLLPQLTNPRTELKLIQHTVEMYTRPKLQLDTSAAASLKRAMGSEMYAALPEGNSISDISGNKSFDGILSVALAMAGDNANKYRKGSKNGPMYALAQDDPQRETLLNHPDPLVRQLVKARLAVKSWPLHICRISNLMDQAECRGGWLGVPLKYYGAHTGRWSGGDGINLQNLGSKSHSLINAVRTLIVPPKNHKLVIVDAAQIEARVLAWVAGQTDLVEAFRNKADIYCQFAQTVLGKPVRKQYKFDDPRFTDLINEEWMMWARGVGKIGILGCGYGMGADHFRDFAASSGVDLTPEMAVRTITTYRKTYPHICKFWYDIESAFVHTAKYRRFVKLANNIQVEPYMDSGVAIRLPNSRKLFYNSVWLVDTDRGKPEINIQDSLTKSFMRIWGGVLTENIVQAIARDILAETLLRVECHGLPVALHIHDELVAVVKDGDTEGALYWMIAEMSKSPIWGPGLPLSAEGFITEKYGGH